MNYAENALFSNPDSEAIALIGIREGLDTEELVSWKDFRNRVRIAASALRNAGVKKGDRVAALVAVGVGLLF